MLCPYMVVVNKLLSLRCGGVRQCVTCFASPGVVCAAFVSGHWQGNITEDLKRLFGLHFSKMNVLMQVTSLDGYDWLGNTCDALSLTPSA